MPALSWDASLLAALAAGVIVAAAAGLRAFLPLLAIGLAARFLGLPLHPDARWLATDSALVALGVATLLEIAADKIPVVDHALDALGTGLRPLSAAFGAFAMLVAWPEPWSWLVAALLGGGALALQLARAQLRVGSTLLTGGLANPVLSFLEDLAAALLLAAAIFAPLFGVVVLAGVLAGFLRRRSRAAASGGRPG